MTYVKKIMWVGYGLWQDRNNEMMMVLKRKGDDDERDGMERKM